MNEWKDLAIGDEDYREIFKSYMGVQKEHKEARKQIRGSSCGDPEMGTGGLDSTEKSQNIGFLNITGLYPLKNQKATKPAFTVGPSAPCQRNVIQIAFRH